jgi:multidrug transporter EmrE-like cation transporter
VLDAAWRPAAIPLITAYPIRTGIGPIGAFLTGVTILGEQTAAARITAARSSSRYWRR